MNPQVLEKYRKKKNLSITELSAKMGRTPGWYSRIKDGKQPLPTRYITPLAELFGIKPERLAKEYFSGEELDVTSNVLINRNNRTTTPA